LAIRSARKRARPASRGMKAMSRGTQMLSCAIAEKGRLPAVLTVGSKPQGQSPWYCYKINLVYMQ